jgi:hypothetical protein
MGELMEPMTIAKRIQHNLKRMGVPVRIVEEADAVYVRGEYPKGTPLNWRIRLLTIGTGSQSIN